MHSSNMHASRSAVDALLKDLGAEPLFSSIKDQPMSIPTPLNGPNNSQALAYRPANAVQQDQKAFSDAFVSLLQRINSGEQQQTTQSFNHELSQNQFSNPNSNQVGLPNPISIMNEIHQRHRRSSVPPKYSFSIDSTTGYFYCQLDAFGKTFKTERPSLRKQQAKEEAALLALRNFVNDDNSSDNNNNNRLGGSELMRLYDSNFNYLENRTDIPSKSEAWYRKQLNEFPGKQPRVILLEFCQMHRLPVPSYNAYNDYVGNTYFECSVGDRIFKSDKTFPRSNEARDYIAGIAFDAIYREICETEREQSRRRNELGQDMSRSSLLNFLENHTSSHISSPVTSSRSTNPNINNNNINNNQIPLLNNYNTSLTLPSTSSNANSGTHLNELTSGLVLPNFNHEIPNIKVEEARPLERDVSIILPNEGNTGNINYSTRDQHQSSSSPISFHPYRSPGRERFPQNPGFNNNNSQFTKKSGGFCKKFTSLLYEMAQAKRWTPPEFNYENGVNGFVCVCSIQDCLFRGKAFSRKMDAKESAAEEAYRFLTRNYRV